MGMAIEIRITIIVMTTISSTKVKPRRRALWARKSFHGPASGRLTIGRRLTICPTWPGPLPGLPLGVRSSIGSLLGGLGVDVEDVLAAPTGGLGVVLIAAQSPVGLAGDRIARDVAQEAHLLAFGTRQLHALHQHLEGFRVTVRVHLVGAEVALIAIVLILVDGLPHFAQGVAKLALALRAHFVAGQGDCHGC